MEGLMGESDKQIDYRDSHTAEGFGEYYDSTLAQAWPAYMWRRERKVLDRILRRYLAGRAINHLDFACGTGRVIGHLQEQTATATGVDISESMLEACRQQAPAATLIQADITTENVLADQQFNLITAFRFFPNAQQELRLSAAKTLVSHLSPEGIFVFNNHRNSSSLLFRLAAIMGKNLPSMSRREVAAVIEAAGLELVKCYPMGLLPATGDHMFVPGWLHAAADGLFDACRLGRVLSQNVIYVCRRK